MKQLTTRFKEIEKIILPFLYNLQKSDEPYIHWPNRGPIIKAQIEKLLKLTRGSIMKLSNNFSLNEMTKSQTAERKGISNNPSEDHMNNLKAVM